MIAPTTSVRSNKIRKLPRFLWKLTYEQNLCNVLVQQLEVKICIPNVINFFLYYKCQPVNKVKKESYDKFLCSCFLRALAPKIVLGVPQGTIYLPRNKRDKHSNVSCSVENTDGKPNITMLYTTVKDVEIRVEGIVEAENNHSSYFNSSQKAKLLALDSGHLTCHVADKIGIYIAKKFMAVTGKYLNCLKWNVFTRKWCIHLLSQVEFCTKTCIKNTKIDSSWPISAL